MVARTKRPKTQKEVPILFTGEMVRAILDSRKTVTRRLLVRIKGFGKKFTEFAPSNTAGYDWHLRDKRACWNDLRNSELLERCPYGITGETLWVKESHRLVNCTCPETCRTAGMVFYEADSSGYQRANLNKLRPSIHMPRWASRINLEVRAVRVERLHDITEADAVAEGLTPTILPPLVTVMDDRGCTSTIGEDYIHGIPKLGDEFLGGRVTHVQHAPARQVSSARDNFRAAWYRINGPLSWDENPWVWVVAFHHLHPLPVF